MVKIENLQDVKNILKKHNKKIFWVWVTAYMRLLPALLFWENFEIVCYKNSIDNKIFKKITKIHSLQENNIPIEKLNTINIMNSEYFKSIISNGKENYLCIYKNSKDVEIIAKKNGLKIIWNESQLRSIFENKKIFREILDEIWVESIYWENITYDDFFCKDYDFFQKKYSHRIVIQLPDINLWWWLWTIFIHSKWDFDNFKDKIRDKTFKNTQINTLNITKFISWMSTSITWCCTRFWTLTTTVQTQIIDIEEVINLQKWNWLFCWHDWSFRHYNNKVNKKAQNIAQKIWDYMYQKWYKWIFGLDLIVDEKNDDVFVVECNSRYTWAFPMISFLDLKNWVIPMDAFHILEFLDLDYKIDFDEINAAYKYNKEWSHIILSNKENFDVIFKKDLLPWIYNFDWNKINYLRDGFSYNDLLHENEFVIIDGNPKSWEKIKSFSELSRFCHILFPKSIINDYNKLNDKTWQIIKYIYKNYL